MDETWEVETVPDQVTGRHSVQCPQCPNVVEAHTGPGAVEALCVHMNEKHFRPPRGNA